MAAPFSAARMPPALLLLHHFIFLLLSLFLKLESESIFLAITVLL